MSTCSVMIPLASLPNSDPFQMRKLASSQLGVPAEHLEIMAVVPLSEAPPSSDLAIKFTGSGVSVQSLESLLSKQKMLQYQLARCKESLASYHAHNNKYRNIVEGKYKRKIEKLAKIKDDNSKLRQMLKNQLDNSENLRMETQQTVETLREEFERLVKEINEINTNKSRPSRNRSKHKS